MGFLILNHYTTAYDIAIMAKELVKYDKFFSWSTIWIDHLEHTDKKREATMLANTNKLIGKYEGLDGMKTGYHSKAGHCFAGTAKKGDFRLISVVLNAGNSNQRFEDTTKLLDYGFGHITILY
jgi:D-alanyl-D-alanine carboxypeptidase (penicillin-binding protein 5/6)